MKYLLLAVLLVGCISQADRVCVNNEEYECRGSTESCRKTYKKCIVRPTK